MDPRVTRQYTRPPITAWIAPQAPQRTITMAATAATQLTVQASAGNHAPAAFTITLSKTIRMIQNREQSIARY